MNRRKVMRIVCVSFLALGLLLSFSFLLFAIGMEGMRHSYPDPSQFDRYYWIPALPAGLSVYWLATVFLPLPRKIAMLHTSIAAGLSLLWLVLIFEEGLEIAMVAGCFVALSFISSWYAKRLSVRSTSQ